MSSSPGRLGFLLLVSPVTVCTSCHLQTLPIIINIIITSSSSSSPELYHNHHIWIYFHDFFLCRRRFVYMLKSCWGNVPNSGEILSSWLEILKIGIIWTGCHCCICIQLNEWSIDSKCELCRKNESRRSLGDARAQGGAQVIICSLFVCLFLLVCCLFVVCLFVCLFSNVDDGNPRA